MNQPIEAISCCHCTSCQGYIKRLEEKVESLTRTLDMWQEIMGIEIMVSVTGEVENV